MLFNSTETINLDNTSTLIIGTISNDLIPDQAQFDHLWQLHPEEHSKVVIHGKSIQVPRWDRAYEKDYPFSNQVAVAHKAPDAILKYLVWAQANIDQRLNGLFVNWHDGSLSHYHGKHRDSTNGLIHDTPIVTISLGEERIFRMRPYPEGKPNIDFKMQGGDFITIPWKTNELWTHEVPKFTKYKGRRISVTMRAFH